MNDNKVNDLVYWVDVWTNESGIGVVTHSEGMWTEILSGDKYKLLLVANHNISNIKNYKSLMDFVNERTRERKY